MNALECRAKEFATRSHAMIDQRRKYTGEPYIIHPAAVAELVRSVPHTTAMLCAAWLHDVVEDTPITLNEIEHEFGHEIAALVEMLTDISGPNDGNRATRKALDKAHLATASAEAKTIKLADLVDNTHSIMAFDPHFAKVFLREKALLLEVLKEGDVTLMALASEFLK